MRFYNGQEFTFIEGFYQYEVGDIVTVLSIVEEDEAVLVRGDKGFDAILMHQLYKYATDEVDSVKISPHYAEDADGKDYLQRFFENSTQEEVRGAMVFTMGKYIERLGKKDAVEKELGKIIDYATRYRDFLAK